MTSHIGVSIAGPTSSFVLRYTLTQTHRSVHQSPSTDVQNTMKISEKYTYTELHSLREVTSVEHLSNTRLIRPFGAKTVTIRRLTTLCSPSYLLTLPPARSVLLSTPRLMLTLLIPVWCFLWLESTQANVVARTMTYLSESLTATLHSWFCVCAHRRHEDHNILFLHHFSSLSLLFSFHFTFFVSSSRPIWSAFSLEAHCLLVVSVLLHYNKLTFIIISF